MTKLWLKQGSRGLFVKDFKKKRALGKKLRTKT